MAEPVHQTENWVGTNEDDYFEIKVAKLNKSIIGYEGNDTFDVDVQDGNWKDFFGGEGNDTYIINNITNITIDEINRDGDGDDSVYIQGGIVTGLINLGYGNDTLYLKSGDGLKDNSEKSHILLNHGNNKAYISGGSNYAVSSYAGIPKTGKTVFNVSGGKKIDVIVGGGDTVTISGGNAIGVESGYHSWNDLNSVDTNYISITGGKEHTLSGSLMDVAIGQTGNKNQPESVYAELSNNAKDKVSVYGGTNHKIVNGGNVLISGGELITVVNANKVTVSGGNRAAVSKSSNVSILSGNNNVINEDYVTNETDNELNDTFTISGGTGNRAYGGLGNNTLTISGGSNNYIQAGFEAAHKSGYEAFETLNITGGSNNTAEKGHGNVNFYLENGKNNKVLADTQYEYYENITRVNGGSGHIITGGNSVDSLTLFADAKAQSKPFKISANLGENDDIIIVKAGKSNTINGEGGNDTFTLSNGTANKFSGGTGTDQITISGGSNNKAYGGADGDILTISGGSKNTVFSGTGDSGTYYSWSSGKQAYDKLYIKGGTQNYAKTTDSTADFTNFIYVSGGKKHIISGGKGTDILSITGKASNISMNLGTFSGSAKDTVTVKTSAKTSLTITGGKNTVVNAGTSSYANTILLKGGSGISVAGGKKADTFTAKGGKNHSLNGGKGNDKLTVSGGNSQTLTGGKGSDAYSVLLNYKSLNNKKLSYTINQSGDKTKASKDTLVFQNLKSTQVRFNLTANDKDLNISVGSGKKASVISIKNWKTNNLSSITFNKDKKILTAAQITDIVNGSVSFKTSSFNKISTNISDIESALPYNTILQNKIQIVGNI